MSSRQYKRDVRRALSAPKRSTVEEPPTPISPEEQAEKQTRAAFSAERDLFKTQYALLQSMQQEPYWSGTGHQYDVDFRTISEDYQKQLVEGKPLGRAGVRGCVRQISYRGLPLAKKYKTGIEALKLEAEVLKKIKDSGGHHHIVSFVGSFWDESHHHIDTSYILTWPVAVCDLDQHLDDVIWRLAVEDHNLDMPLERYDPILRLKELGLPTVADVASLYIYESLVQWLHTTMGCLANAIRFLHSHEIEHCDLKPANILLRHGQVYLTDFGISRNRSERDNTTTQFYTGHTRGYTAPEVLSTANGYGAINPKEADVFSLGCIYLHIKTVIYHSGLVNTEPRRTLSIRWSSSSSIRARWPSPPRDERVDMAIPIPGPTPQEPRLSEPQLLQTATPGPWSPRLWGHRKVVQGLTSTLQVRGIASRALTSRPQDLAKAVDNHIGLLKQAEEYKNFHQNVILKLPGKKDDSFDLIQDMLLVDRTRRPPIEAVIQRLGVARGRPCHHCTAENRLWKRPAPLWRPQEGWFVYIKRVVMGWLGACGGQEGGPIRLEDDD